MTRIHAKMSNPESAPSGAVSLGYTITNPAFGDDAGYIAINFFEGGAEPWQAQIFTADGGLAQSEYFDAEAKALQWAISQLLAPLPAEVPSSGLFVALDRMHASYGQLHDVASGLAEGDIIWTEEIRGSLADILAGPCLEAMTLAGAALAGNGTPDDRVIAAYRQFIKNTAAMGTLDDEFSAQTKRGARIRDRYDDVDDYRSDLSDDRLCTEFGNLEGVIKGARQLLKDPNLQPPASNDALAFIRAKLQAHDDALNNEDQEGGPQAPTGDDYNDIFRIVMEDRSEHGAPASREHPAIAFSRVEEIVEKGCSCDKHCRLSDDRSCDCHSGAAAIYALLGFAVPDLQALQEGEVLGVCTSGMLVQWNAEEKALYVAETLEEFGLKNLREHELSRVGVTHAAWIAAIKD